MRELQRLQEVRVPLNGLACLELEARDVLQKVNLPVQPLVLNLPQTLLKGCLRKLSEVHWLIHCLDRRISCRFLEQSVCTEAVFGVLHIDLLEVQIVHPLVGHVVNSERVPHHVFV